MHRCKDCGKPLAREAVAGSSAVCADCVPMDVTQKDAIILAPRIRSEARLHFKQPRPGQKGEQHEKD